MDSSRLNFLSSQYVDDLDMQLAALEVRSRRRFQQERDQYRHSVGVATTKLQQYCLGMILSHHGPNSAIYALVEDAARSHGLPVDLWSMHEVKQVWDYIVTQQRAYPQGSVRESEQHEYQTSPLYTGQANNDYEHPKLDANRVFQQHDQGGINKERTPAKPTRLEPSQDNALTVARSPWDDPPIIAAGMSANSIDSALARAGKAQGGLPSPLPQRKDQMKKRSSRALGHEPHNKEEIAAAKAAADKAEDARLEAEAEKQRMEDAECAERERAAIRAKDEEDKAKGVLNPIQQMELDEARKTFQGELTDNDQRILAEAKKEYGEDYMTGVLKETKKILDKIIMRS